MSEHPFYDKSVHDLKALQANQYRRLGQTDLLVTKLSLGCSSFGGIMGALDESPTEIVRYAIRNGITLFDTAPWYGQGKSEEALGQALQGIPRHAYYIATKVGRYELDPMKMFDFSAAKTEESIEKSLKKLNVDYIDLCQVHDVEFAPNVDIILNETLPVLQKAKESGKIKYIGITGYALAPLLEILAKSTVKIDSVLSYSRCSLSDDSLEQKMTEFKAHNVGIINAAPTGMGLLTDPGPQPWHPATNHMKAVCKEAAVYCQEHGESLANLSVYHGMNADGVDTCLVGTNSIKVVEANLKTSRLGELSPTQKDIVKTLNARFFGQLSPKHWEGFEVAKYRAKLAAPQQPNDDNAKSTDLKFF